MNKTITDRQKMVLQAIVRAYTETGAAVGSKALATWLPIHVSSATIRNDMAALEEAGYVQKEHTSSGRVPSLAGYRYYVDHLVNDNVVDHTDIQLIQNELSGSFSKIDEIVEESANLLSKLTSYTAFTLRPEQADARLSGFRLVPLGNRQVMAILVMDSGDVANQTFVLPRDMDSDQLEAVVRLINDQLVGLPLTQVMEKLRVEIPAQVSQYMQTPNGFLNLFGQVLDKAAADRYFVGGRLNLLNFSTNHDLHDFKSLYQLFDTTDDIASVLSPPDSQVQVQIGDEITNDLLKDYSLVTGTYDVGAHGRGMIAVLGPTRMPYSRMIGLVGAFREELAAKLLDYYRHLDED
ncbi:heat-inducible transcriptional repressor HrcA [Furfurilactobacillus sp. WILCCON 0119]